MSRAQSRSSCVLFPRTWRASSRIDSRSSAGSSSRSRRSSKRCSNAQPRYRAVVTGGHIGCPNELMAALPALGIIAINGVGVDKVDLSLARARGVQVVRTPGVLADDVADLAVGLVIGLLRGIPAADAFVRRGEWEKGSWPLARKVSGRRFGILGLGEIGSAIATAPGALRSGGLQRSPAQACPVSLSRRGAGPRTGLGRPGDLLSRERVDASPRGRLGDRCAGAPGLPGQRRARLDRR